MPTDKMSPRFAAIFLNPRAAAIFALVCVATILAIGNGNARGINWERVVGGVNSSGYFTITALAPFLFLAGTLIGLKRSTRHAVAVAGFGVAFGTVTCVTSVLRIGTFYESYGPWMVRIAAQPSNALAALAMVLLLAQRLRSDMERWRIASCIVLGVLAALHILLSVVYVGGWWIQIPRLVITCASLPLFFHVSWCLAFRQSAAPHRPPVDAVRVVELTCPRCRSGVQVPSGHGECQVCRLQITISLNEGVCSRCGYALRGLTGERCPECGAAITGSAIPEPGVVSSGS